MTTASTSSRLIADATPVPSASTARSTIFIASSSPWARARAQTPLVSRVRPRFSMISKSAVCFPRFASRRARASIAPRPA